MLLYFSLGPAAEGEPRATVRLSTGRESVSLACSALHWKSSQNFQAPHRLVS